MVKAMEIMGIVISLMAFAYAAWLYLWVKKQPHDFLTVQIVINCIRYNKSAFIWRCSYFVKMSL